MRLVTRILAIGALGAGPSAATPAGGCQGLEVLTYDRDASGAYVLIETRCRTGSEPILPWYDAPHRDLPAHFEESAGSVIQFEQHDLEGVEAQPIEDLELEIPRLEIRPRD